MKKEDIKIGMKVKAKGDGVGEVVKVYEETNLIQVKFTGGQFHFLPHDLEAVDG